MSDAHVNTFVWVEVHVSSGGPLRYRIEIILKCLTIRNIIEYKMVSSVYRPMLALIDSGKSLM